MKLLHEKYRDRIQGLIDEYLGVLGIYAVSLNDKGESFSVNSTETFPTASIIKIPLLMEYHRKAEAGTLDPKEKIVLPQDYICGGSGVLQHLKPGITTLTLDDFATLMIVLSDNVATNLLYDKVGNDNVNILLDTLGLMKTRLRRKMQAYRDIVSENENIATPEDMTNLLKILYKADDVSEYVASKTIEKLKLYKDGMIRDSVPDGIEIADKSGWMGGVHCNTGIVYSPKNTYAVTIMFKHLPKSDKKGLETWLTARKILGLIYEYYDEAGSATKYGIRM